MKLHRLAAALGCASVAVALPTASFAADKAHVVATPKISGPHSYENLAVYFLHGKSEPGPVPLTLEEALARGKVTVHETGSVERLTIENHGGKRVFVQAGDIVKGGRQDRVLTISLLLPPKSGRIPIGAYCVESGRWARRGVESTARFSSAAMSLPSRAAKMAILAPRPAPDVSAVVRTVPTVRTAPDVRLIAPPPTTSRTDAELRRLSEMWRRRVVAEERREAAERARLDERLRRGAERLGITRTVRRTPAAAPPSAQDEVWRNVADIQSRLAARLGTSVLSARSRSSLQLSLENQKLAEAQAKILTRLEPLGRKGTDIIGYAFAINGRINSAEIYPSNGLFRKMWPKLIKANATEALSEQDAGTPSAKLPSIADIRTFLTTANKGERRDAKLRAKLRREVRENDATLSLATTAADGRLIHRSILARR